MNLTPIILSGGAGTRLWPASRGAYPKPFMQIEGISLLERTLRRACRVSDGTVLTTTAKDFYFLTRDLYDECAPADCELHYLLEPVARNTAAAVITSALHLQAGQGDEAMALVLPADHLIEDADAFARAVETAREVAAQGQIVTFGIKPRHPETGFGYLRKGRALNGGGFALEAFVEKPDAQRAEEYVADGQHFWNAGIFLFRVGDLVSELETVAPELLAQARACLQDTDGESQPVILDQKSFAEMESISFDYAVMEKASRRAMVPVEFGWSDIGSWQAMGQVMGKAMDPSRENDADGNQVDADAVLVDVKNTIVRGGNRLVAALGVKDLVIVDTDDAVLVTHKQQAQNVGQVVAQLREAGREEATFHRTVHRPWGTYTVLEDKPTFKVKRLLVKPGEILSLQMHHQRSEHWTVVKGKARVVVGEKEFDLNINESTYVPVETKHRLANPFEENVEIIEVQCGDYLGEDDIVRFEDVYGRTGLLGK